MLRISPDIFARFPGVVVGVLMAQGLDNRAPAGPFADELRSAEPVARAQLTGALVEHPRIHPWREAYRAFGARPKKHPSSIEALARRVVAGKPLPSISPLVDLYNAVSLRHLLPVGGEDLDRIDGPLELRFAGGHEPEVELLGRPSPAAPIPGEVIYADRSGAVCRRWNWREAARTALTAETSRAIFVVEALPPATEGDVRAALEDLRSGLQRLSDHLSGPSARLQCELRVLS